MTYDIAIIGGGITGAAIAKQAAESGKKVLILEKNDWASGTSSKTSKLIHGGLRYLETFDFKLVKESLKAREDLLNNRPNDVKPYPIILPIYKTDKRPYWKIKLGLILYDLFAKSKILPKHRTVPLEELKSKFPNLKTEGLKAAIEYHDAQVHDEALVKTYIQEAESAGATCQSHAKVTQLIKENGKITGLKLFRNKQKETITAKTIINAAGPWADGIRHLDNPNANPLLSPTKGVHLVFPKTDLKEGLILSTPQDARVFFILPWYNQTIIGTTDTDHTGNPDQLTVTDGDIHYLLEATKHYFPTGPFTEDTLTETYAGLRPLLKSKKSPSGRSRDFKIETADSGLITIVGGKYTTHNHMATTLLKSF